MNWVAWCVDGCGVLDVAPNGKMVFMIAKKHMKDEGHKVLVGFFPEEES